MTIMKNKYFIIVLILIVGLVVNFGLHSVAFGGGGGGGEGGGGDADGDGIPDSSDQDSADPSVGESLGDGGNGGGAGDGNGGGWDYFDPSPSPPPQAPTVTLTTWPTFELPDPVSLNWSSSNANSCIASLDWSGSKATQGQESLAKPRGNYSFTLTCSGPGGSASDTENTRVIQVPRCSFVANPLGIIPPQTSTLSWACQYADTCSIDNNIGSVDNVSGAKEVRPTKTTTYTLDCAAPDGSRSYQATVSVGFLPWLREILPR